jgi:hypothetical protein
MVMGMNVIRILLVLSACQFAEAAEKAIWYDAKGQPVGELSVGVDHAMQPNDLIQNNRPLIRATVAPWNAGRNYRIRSEYDRHLWYAFGPEASVRVGFQRIPEQRFRCDAARSVRRGSRLHFSFQNPGLCFQWYR